MELKSIIVTAVEACGTLLRPLRSCVSGGRRFACRVEDLIDETCPEHQDRFLCVYMSGRIRTARPGIDTEVRVELLDITDGLRSPEQILSSDPEWRGQESPVFFCRIHNGVIPYQDALLATEVVVTRIPFHVLRFARRGRRTIQVTTAILDRSNEEVIVQAMDRIEYVFCQEGYLELQQRREAVLQACVGVACAVAADKPAMPSLARVVEAWIRKKTQHFTPRSNLAEPLTYLNSSPSSVNAEAACDHLLAFGKNADHLAALELSLQVAAVYPVLSHRQEELLWSLKDIFKIPQETFLAMCQKHLLTPGGSFERWRLLLGIRQELSPEELRQHLNDEYRKWNGRVTHSAPQIRKQADGIMSLIAEVRGRMLFAVPSASAAD